MKKLQLIKKLLVATLLGSAFALTVAGCSDKPENKQKEQVATPKKANHNPNPWDHSTDVPVTDTEKRQFEHDFAAQCIDREAQNSDDVADKGRFSKPCHCIAQFLSKDLTSQEAGKFLSEHENPQSLRIKYENAAYHCLQEKTPPKEPDFSRQQ